MKRCLKSQKHILLNYSGITFGILRETIQIRMKKIIKITLLSVIMLVGSSVVSAQKKKQGRKYFQERNRVNVEQMKEDLNLSEKQTEQVTVIAKERNQQLKSLRASRAKLDEMTEEERSKALVNIKATRRKIMSDYKSRLAEVLDKEQLEKLKLLQQERKKERKAIDREQMQHKELDGKDMHQVEGAENG